LSFNGNDPDEQRADKAQEEEVDRLVVQLGFPDLRPSANTFLAGIRTTLGIPANV
jgi:hypothetical protein